ncbi:GDSL esterase/lipase At5g42170-like [Mangifera indica]|uniref:GDSL esterase/lipase At5g42170-like n=1 Tax=Mangifera indica TaxID=29780 RepID=UPI001CFB4569|nr:GDSL esterase/lipase At5g42170-like [Mangifera indica]
MPFINYASIYSLLVITILRVYTCEAIVKFNVTVSAFFAFGDSILDSGNNNNQLTLLRCNFPPYGRDFMGGKATGRYCNGKNPADILVEKLGLKEVLPAYLDPNIQSKDLLTGVNFASGGAGYDSLTSEKVSAIPLTKQLRMFEEYMGKVKEFVGEEAARKITANSVSMVSASSNDIANTYFLNSFRPEFNISGYTDLLAASASDFLDGLYNRGARKIGVFGAPPLGCLPIIRTFKGAEHRSCVTNLNEAAQLFNSKLKVVLHNLKAKYPDSRIVLIDDYTIVNDMIQAPETYGFEVSDKGCCGTGTFEVGIFCNQWTLNSCFDASKYVFWDSYHPTEAAYRVVVDHVYQNIINGLLL